MIISDQFVFIHNPHTGGAFVKTLLKLAFPTAHFDELTAWHEPIQNLDKKHWHKLKFGAIRNPWEWYVSFYFKQQPKGGTLTLALDGKANTFENFLTNLLSLDFAKRKSNLKLHKVGNPYVKPAVPKFDYMRRLDVGFFSYRYIYMFFDNYERIFYSDDKMLAFKKPFSLDEVYDTQNIVENISTIFDKHKIKVTPEVKQKWAKLPIENQSQHKHYREYYSQKLINLVKYKDRLIIEKHGYSF
jgi:hypothetical protein